MIAKVHADNYGVYGARKVHAELGRQGHRVARCTVQRLMRAAGLRGITRAKGPRTTIPGSGPDLRPDLVERSFTATGPNQLWVADITYCRTFGCLTALYNLLGSRDAGAIAKNLDVKNRDIIHGWLKALNVLRNHCAHNARIWNRATVYPPRVPSPALAHERLHHLGAVDNNRLYFLAAITAHLLICLDSSTNWPRQFVTVMRKFPPVHGMAPANTMGFPNDWESLALWRHAPTK